MIPLKLHLKNFLSYGSTPQVINFEPYHLICLSGKNGHGKSALLDALTWSLWGYARKIIGTNKSDESLIRLGQSEMVVALDFMCNNISYRVRREFKSNRTRVISQLDFGMIDPESNRFKPLTGKTIKDTQDTIIRTIGLDFEAFQSSAFLRQGYSDAFSRKSPKERKELLANILGITRYELIRRYAVEKGREEELRKQHTLHTCEMIIKEVTLHANTENELISIEKQHTQLQADEKQLRTVQESLTKQKQELLLQHQLTLHNKTELSRLASDLRLHIEHITIYIKEWRSTHRKKLTLLAISSNTTHEALLIELRSLQQRLTQQHQMVEALVESKETLYTRIQVLRAQFSQKRDSIISEIHYLEGELRSLQVQKTSLEDELQTLHTTCTDYIQRSDATHTDIIINQLNDTITYHEQQYTRIQIEHRIYQLHIQRLTYYLYTQEQELTRTHCSQCTSLITQDQLPNRAHIIARNKHRAEHQVIRLTQACAYNQNQMCVLRETVSRLRTEYVAAITEQIKIHAHLDEIHRITQRINLLDKELLQLNNKYTSVQNMMYAKQQELHSLTTHQEANIAQDPECIALQQSIHNAETVRATYKQVQQRYADIQQQLSILQEQQQRMAQFTHDLAQQSVRIKQITDTARLIRTTRTTYRTLSEQMTHYHDIDSTLKAVEHQEIECLQTLESLKQKKEDIIRRKGALEELQQRVIAQKKALAQQEQEIQTLTETIHDYATLAHAFGKDGIQSMLIEHILPEIEHTANVILSKLTDNQSQLHFESTKELKSGASKETLEIKISDALGVRPYELFSGGEAFRIDFALRLAIARFLAHRSGTAVQTLIIDEGFGSQDEEGISHIMSSLHAIQDEFAKIIIVSHLPSMKEQFPVHFHVQRNSHGSSVQVIEQG